MSNSISNITWIITEKGREMFEDMHGVDYENPIGLSIFDILERLDYRPSKTSLLIRVLDDSGIDSEDTRKSIIYLNSIEAIRKMSSSENDNIGRID